MKKFFITGLLVWAPLAITIWLMIWMLSLLDGVFGLVMNTLSALLPVSLKPSLIEFRNLPGGVYDVKAVLYGAGHEMRGSVRQQISVIANGPDR